MSYQIDFTASNYVSRAWRKTLLRLMLLVVVAGAAHDVYDVYETYNQPTLNMKLAEYEAVARPIEEINAAWDEAAKEYGAMLKYCRLVWAANPTNFLNAMASSSAPGLGGGFKPIGWTLRTGGECQLDYRYTFDIGDKAEQAKGLEARIVNAVTSVVQIATNSAVAVHGVQQENLLDVKELTVAVRFSLPGVKSFPKKKDILTNCVDEIVAMRKKVHETKLAYAGDVKGMTPTVRETLNKYLPKNYEKKDGKLLPEFPDAGNAIDISGWFDRADKFIAKNNDISNDAKRKLLKEAWDRIGNARFPWQRYRALDNDELVGRTKALESVSDGVRRSKDFLDKRRADNKKMIDPFVEVYDHSDIFNKPFVNSDLVDRAAKEAGISSAKVTFKDEAGAEPIFLVKDDETFSITWVRWTLVLGDVERGPGEVEQEENKQLTLAKVADCARRVLEIGPGYAIDSVKVSFGSDGGVAGAVIEGILPVKKVESKKEDENQNVD